MAEAAGSRVDTGVETCMSCESPAASRWHLDECTYDISPSLPTPGTRAPGINFSDSTFARALQRHELAAHNPTYDSDRSLALLMNIGEDDIKPEAGDDVRALFTCRLCSSAFGWKGTVAVDACGHHVCIGCMRAHVHGCLADLSGPAQLSCPVVNCPAHLAVAEIRRFGGPGAYDQFIAQRFYTDMHSSSAERLVKCPACETEASVQCETPRAITRRALSEAPAQANDGERLATPYRVHFTNHRFRCVSKACPAEFCGACAVTPYHLGYTCEEWAELRRLPHCRFCEDVIPASCACVDEPEALAAEELADEKARRARAVVDVARLPMVAHGRVPFKHAAFSAAKRLVPRAWQRPAPVRVGGVCREPLRAPNFEPALVGRALAPPRARAAAGEAQPVAPVRKSTPALACRRVWGEERGWQSCCAAECVERGSAACLRALSCGHPCCGVRSEAVLDCVGCLQPECVPAASAHPESAEDVCSICWAEPLSAAPCLRLGCTHLFHAHCLRERLRQRWAGRAINFEYARCPLCKVDVTHRELEVELRPHAEDEKVLRSRALERLHYDGLDKAPEIVDAGGDFHSKPVEFALRRYVYYECHTCKLPYFGGLAACAVDLEQRDEAHDPRQQVCGGCSSAAGAPNTSCTVHGRDYIEYKCRFCCSVATWYCWGNTHFCDGCHAEASTVMAKPCTCGKPHPPNGKEHSLGCSLCHATSAF
ncbi:hypothetical protein T492DRAFT_985372 [Pavlovales sp. CCMP2436]|nr:hypothetical protein T492DRAFT_985372 [Pavlovales sp. CCMP2436]